MEISESSSIKFGQYWLILKRRWLPASAVFGLVFTLSLFAAFLKEPVYVAEGKLRFNRTSPTSSFTGLGGGFGELEPLVEQSNPLNTEAEVIRSVPVVKETIDQLNLRNEEGDPLKRKAFLDQLSLEEIRETDILQVSYQATDPEKAAAVVNAVMEVYLDENILSNRAQAVAAREFIEKQLPQAEARVSQAEADLRQFKEKNNVVALPEKAKAVVQVTTDLQKQIGELQSQLANTDAQAKVLQNRLGMNSQQAVARTSLSQSQGVQEVLQQLQEVESELAVKRTILQEINPAVVSLKERKAALESLLQERAQAVINTQARQPGENLQIGELQQTLTAELIGLEASRLGFAAQINTLNRLQNTYRQQANALPMLEQLQRELERKLDAAQSTYSVLLQKLQEIQVAENQNVGNVRVLSTAEVPEEPVSSRQIDFLAAGLLGILASAATIYVLERRDTRIKTVDEARKLLGYTLLGVIPAFDKFRKLASNEEELNLFTSANLIKDNPRSPISEAYRRIRANLKFVSAFAPNELKVVVVTSSVPTEGKSTVSANLAVAMALLGRKVLLVDADLRCPTQHLNWELDRDPGLSHVLVGQIGMHTAIKSVMENLDVLAAGVVPPNPGDLIDSQPMTELIKRFAANYDFVIIDTPSLGVAADAAILGRMADGVLFVVKPGVADYASATFAAELLEKSGQNVLGQVVNGVTPENEPSGYYYSTKEYYTKDHETTAMPQEKIEKTLKW